MKVKVGTQLEEEILSELKVRAAQEKKPMAEIIQEAVVNYLKDDRKTVDRSASLLRILENPSRLPDEAYRDLIEADYYDQTA
jgi:metal-responsive CopG/Arc/MetJ family transcriptional regulator